VFDSHLAAAALGHITQIDTIDDLYRGNYEAHATVREVFTNFTVGLGVAEACDGEIVACDNTVWRVPADGHPRVAADDLGLAFVVVGHGGTPVHTHLSPGLAMADVLDPFDSGLVTAIRIDGSFTNVLLRSEHRQTPPYKPLPDVLSEEVRFEFQTWEGTLVGFRFPLQENGSTVPGVHLHGISHDNLSGGHCHSFTVVRATATLWRDDYEIKIPYPPVYQQKIAVIQRSGAPAQVREAERLADHYDVTALDQLHRAVMDDPYLTREENFTDTSR